MSDVCYPPNTSAWTELSSRQNDNHLTLRDLQVALLLPCTSSRDLSGPKFASPSECYFGSARLRALFGTTRSFCSFVFCLARLHAAPEQIRHAELFTSSAANAGPRCIDVFDSFDRLLLVLS